MKKIIFIAEDEEMLVKMYGAMFALGGYETVIESDGESALKTLKLMSPKPDLIILDILMPVMDGLEVLQKIKQSAPIKDIPVIILTNLSVEQEGEKAKSLGALMCLSKTQHHAKDVVAIVDSILGSVKK